MSGPPLDHHEELRLLKQVANTTISAKPFGYGIKDTPSTTVLVEVTDLSTRFFCRRFSSRNESAFSYGTQHVIKGLTGSIEAVVYVENEDSADHPDMLGQGIGNCWLNLISRNGSDQRTYEFEGWIFLPREVLQSMQHALTLKNGAPCEIELTISVPTDEFIEQHDFLWIENLLW